MDAQTISPLLGAFVGILLSLTGAGGGIVSVPLLVFALHLSIAEAAPNRSAGGHAGGRGHFISFMTEFQTVPMGWTKKDLSKY